METHCHWFTLPEGLKDGNIPPFSGLMFNHKKNNLNCDMNEHNWLNILIFAEDDFKKYLGQ